MCCCCAGLLLWWWLFVVEGTSGFFFGNWTLAKIAGNPGNSKPSKSNPGNRNHGNSNLSNSKLSNSNPGNGNYVNSNPSNSSVKQRPLLQQKLNIALVQLINRAVFHPTKGLHDTFQFPAQTYSLLIHITNTAGILRECILPTHPDILLVIPHLENHGRALGWEKPYIPHRGLFCGEDVIARKPFRDRKYCYAADLRTTVLSHLASSNYLL
ncbi:hypothetical protein BZA77DRAFT_297653 [Pyronema omphalodes]|nr:hypothetical protein BZA77DRAFT_297653 [Pyronema omphalodes]